MQDDFRFGFLRGVALSDLFKIVAVSVLSCHIVRKEEEEQQRARV
jgi:hypothetical protein